VTAFIPSLKKRLSVASSRAGTNLDNAAKHGRSQLLALSNQMKQQRAIGATICSALQSVCMDHVVSLRESGARLERDSSSSQGHERRGLLKGGTPDNNSIGKTHHIFFNSQLVHQNSDTFVVI
jgi:hypothetical protein